MLRQHQVHTFPRLWTAADRLPVLVICALLFALAFTPAGGQTCPASCADVLSQNPSAVDGQYTITANGDTFSVYCNDMAGGSPTEYLTLVNTGGDFNFGQYTAGGASPGTDVRTNYTRIPLDLMTYTVDATDRTFATSMGSLIPSGGSVATTETDYGRATDCVTNNSATGLANVDLTGLPFIALNNWTVAGFNANGTTTFSSNDQIVDVTGGGFCGTNVPTDTTPSFTEATIALAFDVSLAPPPPACTATTDIPTLDLYGIALLSVLLAICAVFVIKR